MATTEQRSGFRLPWTSEPRSTSEPPEAETPDETPAASDDAQATADATAASSSTTKESSTTAGPDGVEASSTETDTVSPETATAPAPTLAKRPTKFLADLTRAMQAAAEEARTQAVSQLEAEAKAYIENIHAQSSGQASELRKRADDDLASIREWSKAELARVKEVTDVRIAARKTELEAQLERHAAVIEQEVERVNGQVASFEGEMTKFFEDLLVEQDPTRFAALAESLPEPPPFGTIAMDLDELLASATLASSNGSATTVEPATIEADAPDVEATLASGSADSPALGGDEALASFQAAVEAAAQAEAGAAHPEQTTEHTEAVAETTDEDATNTDKGADATATAAADTADTETPHDAAGTAHAAATTSDGDTATDGENLDPRIHALGLDDFDAAEAEAVAGAADEEEIPIIDDDALSARLDGLMPDRANAPKAHPSQPTGDTSTTQVVVVGLVSVASIASFKRHLGRIPHVNSVGVSSGPDGEFVFTVSHTGDVSLREVVATLPGFAARVTNTGDGVVNVTAHDPESEG